MKKIIPAIFLFSAGSYAAAIPEAQLKEMWLSPKVQLKRSLPT